MSEFTSTREGFQRAMERSLKGSPEETKAYVESILLPNFHHIMNYNRLDYDAYVDNIIDWRRKVTEYTPVV